MFGSRRQRQPSQPLTISTANPSAATAALAVFRRNDPNPTPGLSSAAAAAALKARPHTPTNVSAVQTKRTARRSASVSSRGSVTSSVNNNGRPELQRRGSSGSMTERSFRSPSPRRPSSSGGLGHRYAMSQDGADRPPVPSIPRDIIEQPRKTTSLGIAPLPLKVGSQRLQDPRHGTYFSQAAVGDLSAARKSDAVLREAVEPRHQPQNDTISHVEARPSSRNSVNFSYPARVRSPPASPIRADAPSFPPLMEHQASPQQHPRQVRHQRVSSTASSDRSAAQRAPSVSSVQSMVYDPNSRRMVPRYEPQEPTYEEPYVRKKKTQQHSAREGAHLAQGTLGRTRGTAVHESEPQQHRSPPPAVTRQRASERAPEPARDEVEYAEPAVKAIMPKVTTKVDKKAQLQRQTEEVPVSPSNYLPEVDTRSQARYDSPRPPLNKKPSIVHEESEPESEPAPAIQPESQSVLEAVDALPVKQSLYDPSSAEPSRTEGTMQPPAAVGIATTSPIELPTERDTIAPARIHDQSGESSRVSSSEQKQTSPPPTSLNPQVARVKRNPSNSPVRTAHFGPILDNNLGIKHSPPARSISPRKSALKQRSTSRGASPSTDSEASSAIGRTDRSNSRKKSVRVSFTEDSVVLGESTSTAPDRTASPVSQSPQAAKKPWYSNIGRSKKKDMVSLEEEEAMMPRPALPSFGSIRGKKESREPEERPLVRPTEAAYSPSIPASPAVTPSAVEDHQPESSSDAALGSLLMQEQQRNAANISRFREPLPPVVTSIEGHEFMSDTSSSSESETDLIADTPQLTQEGSALTSQAPTLPESEPYPQPINGSSKPDVISIEDYLAAEPKAATNLSSVPEAEHHVPTISVTHPSQEKLPEAAMAPKNRLDVPGTFPDDESDSTSTHGSKRDDGPGSSALPDIHPVQARQATFEPVSQSQDAVHGSHTPATVLATQPAVVEDDESETDSSIYSDAYEDLSDIEGDGFLSLNAVMESPMATSVTKSPFTSSTTSPNQPTPDSRSEQVKRSLSTVQEKGEASQQPRGDWEIAKSYWRSLTTEKRAQLEREAMEEAGIDADLEEPEQDKKPRRKKSVEKKQAEKKAIQQAYANSDRTYMIQPGTRVAGDAYTPPMQTTLRGQQAPKGQQQRQQDKGPRLRKSMRTNGVPQAQAPEQQQQPSRPVISKQARRQSFPLPEREDHRGHGRTMSDNAVPQKPAMTSVNPPLRRRGSDSSESSFRRVRPGSSGGGGGGGGGFGFRRTMRQEPPPMTGSPDATKDRSHRFSLRSLSPGGSPFRRSSVHSPPPVSMGGMRMSMRDSAQVKPAKSGGLFSSKKSSKASKKSTGSRFDGSSDDDDVPRGFRSRFEDSSDEDVAVSRPVRSHGMGAKTMRQTAPHKSPPLPEEAEDSPDLDSETEKATRYNASAPSLRPEPVTASSFERKPASSAMGTGTLRGERSGRGSVFSSTSPPPNTRRGSGGLFSALRRKTGPGSDSGKVIARGEIMDSAARRDTNLERSTEELEAMRGAPGHRTLQKRVTSVPAGIGRGAPPSWPLGGGRVDEGEEDDELPRYRHTDKEVDRPATSSGPESATKPPMPRRSFSQGVLGIEEVGEGSVVHEGTGAGEKKKKKKFGALRRMFRLDD